MKVAYLINQYPSVSHSFIRREILALERQGFEVLRLALRGWGQPLADAEDIQEQGRVLYVLLGGALGLLAAVVKTIFRAPKNASRALILAVRLSINAERPLPIHLIYLAEACRVNLWLKKHGIEHIHAHFGTNSAEVAMLAACLVGCPWSFTVHGPEEFDKPSSIKLPAKIMNAQFVVAVSSFGRAQLYRQVPHDQWSKIHVVRCGLDDAFFSAQEDLQDRAVSPERLVCVGRLCEQKGQLLLIDAMRRLKADGLKLQLVLAGDGEMRSTIETAILENGLEDCVSITGWLSGQEVRDELLEARALILPSFAEGLPVVIMEAMALRRPVVSTYIAGIPELVHNGVNGWLVPAGDAEELARAIKECMSSSGEQMRMMGAAARERCFGHHRIDTEVLILARLFKLSANVA